VYTFTITHNVHYEIAPGATYLALTGAGALSASALITPQEQNEFVDLFRHLPVYRLAPVISSLDMIFANVDETAYRFSATLLRYFQEHRPVQADDIF